MTNIHRLKHSIITHDLLFMSLTIYLISIPHYAVAQHNYVTHITASPCVYAEIVYLCIFDSYMHKIQQYVLSAKPLVRIYHILGFGNCEWFAITSASMASVLVSHSSRPVELRSPTPQTRVIIINYIKNDSLSVSTYH